MATVDVKSDTGITYPRKEEGTNVSEGWKSHSNLEDLFKSCFSEIDFLKSKCRKLEEENKKLKDMLKLHFGSPSIAEAEKWFNLEEEEFDSKLL